MPVIQQAVDIFLAVKHIHKQIAAAQMRGQGERTGNQAIQTGRIADGLFYPPHGTADQGNAAVAGAGNGADAGDDGLIIFIAGQRVGGNRRGTVICPCQITAQNFCLYLEVKNTALAIRLEHTVDLKKTLNHFIFVLQELRGSVSQKPSSMGTGKGNPGGTGSGFVFQRGK